MNYHLNRFKGLEMKKDCYHKLKPFHFKNKKSIKVNKYLRFNRYYFD